MVDVSIAMLVYQRVFEICCLNHDSVSEFFKNYRFFVGKILLAVAEFDILLVIVIRKSELPLFQ